jgi:uncharacterized membrane protein
MSVAEISSRTRGGYSRWLLLGSLALNLFFIGVAVSHVVRAPAPSWDRNVLVRLDRMAATLPPADADILRGRVAAGRAAIEAAQARYRASQESVRDALRKEPFDGAALRVAMTQSRAARQSYDEAVHATVAASAEQMTAAGRKAVADWPPGRKIPTGPR